MEKNYMNKLKKQMVDYIPEGKGIGVFELGQKVDNELPGVVGKEVYEKAKREENKRTNMPPGFYQGIGDLQDEGKIEIRGHTVFRKEK